MCNCDAFPPGGLDDHALAQGGSDVVPEVRVVQEAQRAQRP
jgi:hypothetical protein